MIRIVVAGAFAWLLAGGAAIAQGAQDSSAAEDGPKQNSVKLARVYADLPVGTPYMSLRVGNTLCLGKRITRTWSEGRVPQRLSPYVPAFAAEVTGAGYKAVTPGKDDVFEEEAGSADYEAAAVITDEHIDGCFSRGGLFSDMGDVRGTGSMAVDWQLYSRLKKQVVAHVSTSGTS